MPLIELSCKNCGAHEFIDHAGIMRCKYCNSMYVYEKPVSTIIMPEYHHRYDYGSFATACRW